MYIFFSYPAICVLRNTQIAEQKEEKKKKFVCAGFATGDGGERPLLIASV